MKKIMFVILTAMVLMTGCTNKLNTYEEINYDGFIEKVENKESFILFVGSATCSHCDAFKKTINKIVKKYQVNIYYIDIHEFTSEQLNKFKTYINFDSTPTTVFIYDGEEKTTYNRIIGNVSYEKVIERLTKEGYIKE